MKRMTKEMCQPRGKKKNTTFFSSAPAVDHFTLNAIHTVLLKMTFHCGGFRGRYLHFKTHG